MRCSEEFLGEQRMMKVCEDDTLASIAIRFGTDKWELKRANKLANDIIFPGDCLIIPKPRTGPDDMGKSDPHTARLVKIPASLLSVDDNDDSQRERGMLIVTPSILMFNSADEQAKDKVADLYNVERMYFWRDAEETTADDVQEAEAIVSFLVINEDDPWSFSLRQSDVAPLFSFLAGDDLHQVNFYEQEPGQVPEMIKLPVQSRESCKILKILAKQQDEEQASPIKIFKPPSTKLLVQPEWQERLIYFLPKRIAQEEMASLVFSTDRDGYSLMNLYRCSETHQDGHSLIIIEDASQQVFGALISNNLRVEHFFYGTGESFLFRTHPAFKAYTWTGANELFIRATKQGIGIGAGQGTYGLWINEDLRSGTSSKCETYDNDRLSGDETGFFIARLELWSFMPPVDEYE